MAKFSNQYNIYESRYIVTQQAFGPHIHLKRLTPSDFLFRNQNVPPGDAILNPESIFYYSP